jgi:hypothetical protein
VVFEVPGTLLCVTEPVAVVATPGLTQNESCAGPLTGWDVVTGRQVWSAYSPDDAISMAHATADDRRVMVNLFRVEGQESRHLVDLRDAISGELIWRTARLGSDEPVFSPPDAKFVAVVDRPSEEDGFPTAVCDLYETATGRWVCRIPTAGLEFSPDVAGCCVAG